MLDELDQKLVALLRTDARMAVANIAVVLKVSRATAKARIDRLLASGVISGFTAVLSENESAGVRAIMMVEIDGKHEEAVMKRLIGLPEVRQLHATNGRWDFVAELEVANVGAFDDLLRTIRQIDGIATTDTSILLKAKKALA